MVGLIDEPDRQRQLPLRWRATDGHHLVGGGRGSGLTSTLLTIAHAAVAAPAADAPLRHRRARRRRARPPRRAPGLRRRGPAPRARAPAPPPAPARREIDERPGPAGPTGPTDGDHPPIVVLIDGYTELREHLGDLTTEAEREALERVLAHGARSDIVAVLAVGQPSAVPPAVLARCDRRWLLHLADEHGAVGWGFRAGDVPRRSPAASPCRPGSTPSSSAAVAGRPPATSPSPRPTPIEALPPDVDSALVGTGRADGGAVRAPPRSRVRDGRTRPRRRPRRRARARARSGAEWPDDGAVAARRRLARGPPVRLVRCHHAPRPGRRSSGHPRSPRRAPRRAAADRAGVAGGGRCRARRRCRPRHRRQRPVRARCRAGPVCVVVAAGTAATLRQSYGHWTGVVRRSRLGLVLGPASELDGDLLGAQLPRRRPIPARPGLAWLVAHGEVRLVQVARHPPCHEEMPPVA